MPKPYLNDAIIGNSKALGCLTKKGELIRLFWPNIDFSQHINSFLMGVRIPSIDNNKTSWLSGDSWEHMQSYIDDTNVLETFCENKSLGVRVKQTDFVLPDKDILVRNYSIENTSERDSQIELLLFSSMVNYADYLRSTLFDEAIDSIVFAMHGAHIVISGSEVINGFQLGISKENAENGVITGMDNMSMSPNSVIVWKMGEFRPLDKKEITIYISLEGNMKQAVSNLEYVKKRGYQESLRLTTEYWKNFLTKARRLTTKNNDINKVYNRTILLFPLLTDSSTGGIIAAPEIDEEFTRCGRYAFCYPRDGVYIAWAMNKCGLTEMAEKFYYWCKNTQNSDGSWSQRYYVNGDIAPGWGTQNDETGSVIWGIWKHYEMTKNNWFLEDVWKVVKLGAEYLCKVIDSETGLPKPSFEPWEERIGEYSYTAAAVYGGLWAAVAIAKELNINENHKEWIEKAEGVKKAFEDKLWDSNLNRFLRGIRVKTSPWDEYYGDDAVEFDINTKGNKRRFKPKDESLDASLFGISVPFEVASPTNEHMKRTVEAIEKYLTVPEVGGIMRYEYDSYLGGNPWVITTLWAALYHIKTSNIKKAEEYINWAVQHRTELDFLPEQVDRNTGKPIWVVPLVWSHAMFALAITELNEKNRKV